MSDIGMTTFDPYDTSNMSDLSEATPDLDSDQTLLSNLPSDLASGQSGLSDLSSGLASDVSDTISYVSSDHDSDPTYEDDCSQKNERVTHQPRTQEDDFYATPSIHFLVDDNLKAYMVDDWERITKQFCVVKLPHPKPVRKILQDWQDYDLPRRAQRLDRDVLVTVCGYLLEIFDKSLDKELLYSYERPQYRYLRSVHKPIPGCGPVDIYGAEHLLRLFSEFSTSPFVSVVTNVSCLQPPLGMTWRRVLWALRR